MDIIFGGFMLFGFTVRELGCPSPDLTKKTHTRQQGCSSSQLQATGVDYTMYEKFPNQCNQKAELFSVELTLVQCVSWGSLLALLFKPNGNWIISYTKYFPFSYMKSDKMLRKWELH
jgi:sensor histidine kinase YesM